MRLSLILIVLFLVGCQSAPPQSERGNYFAITDQSQYSKFKVKYLRELTTAKDRVEREEALYGLIHNADIYGKKEEVVFWCKELLKEYPEDEKWKPIPKDAQRMIDEYSR